MTDSVILKEFKQLLKSARLKAGYNYKELAKQSGISEQSLRKYENEPLTDLPLTKVFHLLKILDVKPDQIIQIINLFY